MDKPTELSPSQIFEQNKDDLIKIFEKEPEKLPDNISKYKIIEELGRGGMGCVYKAHDPQMNRFIALKVILSRGKEQEKVTQRFLQEAKAMGQFSHPNIVRVYDIGKDGNNYFITMDYIEGQSLKDYLQNTPLNIRQFSKFMGKIANAIQYAHEKGIIHRDLKPANMLDKTGEPQVMDFGLAKLNKAEKSLSKKGAILGTPQYMSPEQARGEKVDNLTDVYALGAIFYEMLAGKPLIQGKTVSEIMFTLLNKVKLKEIHSSFIKKAMRKISEKTPKELVTKYVFTIVKMQKQYVVKLLIPYLEKRKWKKLLAIKTLGKLGNNYTKYKGKDCVEWLIDMLGKFKDRKSIEKHQVEVEEIIWALGWLKDERANDMVFEKRGFAKDLPLWEKTKIPYSWIPLKMEISKEDVMSLLVRATMKRDKKNYVGALADLERIYLTPKHPEAYNVYNTKGLVYFGLKEYSKAISSYNQAIAIKPRWPFAHRNRGNSYRMLKRYKKAIADYSQAIAINPKLLSVYINRGGSYANLKDYKKAIADYNQIIAINSKYPRAYSGRGNVYRMLKKYKKAIAEYDKAIELGHLSVYYDRALLIKISKNITKQYLITAKQ